MSEPTSIARMTQKFSEPSVQESLKGFTKTVQFSLTDVKEDYLLAFEDGKLSRAEKATPGGIADITVIASNELMDEILDKKANAVVSYMSGKIKIKGDLNDLMRLQKLLS